MSGNDNVKEPVCGFCGATPSKKKNVPFIPSACFDGLAICGDCLKRGNAALAQFSRAFREFPFHLDVIYTAPVNAGPRNPLWPEPTGYKATMTGFPYDDLKTWRGIYPEDVFAEQFEKVAAGWEKGLAMLEAIKPKPEEAAELAELRRVAAAAACHFRSTADQIAFVRGRDGGAAKSELAALLLRERETARKLHALAAADSRIGFEASNHYFYTLNELREKAVACEWLRRRY